MAEETPQVDAEVLASVLVQARLRLDDVIAHLERPGDRPLRLKEALEDNNSGCNTACSCRSLAPEVVSQG